MKMILTLLLLTPTIAAAADSCATASTTLTAAQKKMYARSISSNLKKWEPPAQIKIDKSIAIGKWTAVWATPAGAEQGVFFYSEEKSGLNFHDVWGGYAIPEEKPSLAQWVKKLAPGVPDAFAQCFAQTVTSGH